MPSKIVPPSFASKAQSPIHDDKQFFTDSFLLELNGRLAFSESIAREVGAFLKLQFVKTSHVVDEIFPHDIKLQLDKLAQDMIVKSILETYPQDAILGEEGSEIKSNADAEWIIDPIDGTVNFFYGIPIFCVSIALRYHGERVLACVYDPMQDECYTAIRGQGALMNGRLLQASKRDSMADCIAFVGHGRHDASYNFGLRRFAYISSQVRKMRILGSAALSLCYIAAGRLDIYIENQIYLWDYAAAALILEEAGARYEIKNLDNDGIKVAILAWNGAVHIHAVLENIPE